MFLSTHWAIIAHSFPFVFLNQVMKPLRLARKIGGLGEYFEGPCLGYLCNGILGYIKHLVKLVLVSSTYVYVLVGFPHIVMNVGVNFMNEVMSHICSFHLSACVF